MYRHRRPCIPIRHALSIHQQLANLGRVDHALHRVADSQPSQWCVKHAMHQRRRGTMAFVKVYPWNGMEITRPTCSWHGGAHSAPGNPASQRPADTTGTPTPHMPTTASPQRTPPSPARGHPTAYDMRAAEYLWDLQLGGQLNPSHLSKIQQPRSSTIYHKWYQNVHHQSVHT
jgi:hypothetical protein